MLVNVLKDPLQALFRGVGRGRRGIDGGALEGVFAIDIVDQFLVNLEIQVLGPYVMVLLPGFCFLALPLIVCFCLVVGKFQRQREYAPFSFPFLLLFAKSRLFRRFYLLVSDKSRTFVAK